ncbi:DUF4349 domain-containing protein [Pseudobutyrivibrio xylanivorans]|uniref:DUF4349 domain-containing protein n=1 Tax=Pseudobutyrivibrio xylanivorans TaxID=185007 RepID=A0A5P6VUB2_PSEXY|nr:DUF4349 domain-containing protein [Pseudobutyrivibrio xylanivorans]QFJ55912.1 DUF4349 domain-containing protein [Pseudobutyrivibrio xylanivorans]
MKRKFVSFLALIIATSFVFAGCGTSTDTATTSYEEIATEGTSDAAGFDSSVGSFYAEEPKEAAAGTTEKSVANSGSAGDDAEEFTYDTSRKIIYNSSINIETKKFDDDIDAIKKLVSKNGGYYESSSINGTAEYGGRYANYTARIPSKNYQAFMDSLGDIGSVTYSNEYVDDITSEYVDVQARLKSLRTKLKRLEELEQNAETIEDLLAIEDRINNVQYDIENYTAQLKLYDDKVEYCTVTISLDEVVTYTEVKKDTAWNRFTEAFASSISGFLAFLQWLVIAFIYILPYALGAGVIAIIVILIEKKRRANKKQKKEKESITYTSYIAPKDTSEDKSEENPEKTE